MPIEIVRASEDISARMCDLRHEWSLESGEDLDVLFPNWRERYTSYISEKLQSAEAAIFLAADSSTVAGAVIVRLVDSYRRYTFEEIVARINALYVRAIYRRKGIARALMQAAIGWAVDRDCSVIRLHASPESRTLYESLGFQTGSAMELALKRSSP